MPHAQSTLKKAFSVKENSKYARMLTIRETDQPETIIVELHNSGADGEPRQTQAVFISRTDWLELMEITRSYNGFRWALEPEPEPEPIPAPTPPIQEPSIDPF